MLRILRGMALVFIISLLLISPSSGKAQSVSDAPYLYYYSRMANAIIVEKADGSDSRILGSGLMPTAHDSANKITWSPSGKWVAWLSAIAGGTLGYTDQRAWIESVDGKPQHTALDGLANVEDISWSPQQDYLAAVRAEPSPDSADKIEFYLIDVAQRRTRQVLIRTTSYYDFDSTIRWSPDGQHVFFFYTRVVDTYKNTGTNSVIRFSLDGTFDEYDLPSFCTQAGFNDLSYGQNYIPYWNTTEQSIYLNGKSNTLTLEDQTGQHFDIAMPAPFISAVQWSPDHQKAFVFGREQCDSPDQMWLLTVADQHMKLITADAVSPLDQSYYPESASDPIPLWSPQSDKGIFQKKDGELYLIDLSSLSIKRLVFLDLPVLHTDKLWMAWSPDGNHLFISKDPQILDVNVNTQQVSQFLTGFTALRLSSDGRFLLFYGACAGQGENRCVADRQTGNETVIMPLTTGSLIDTFNGDSYRAVLIDSQSGYIPRGLPRLMNC